MHAPTTMIEGVCADEVSRYSLTFVHVRQIKDGAEFVATNGHALACVPCHLADDETLPKEGALISSDAIKAARKNKLPVHNALTLDGNKVIVRTVTRREQVTQEYLAGVGKFPNVDDFNRPAKDAKPTVILDAKKLYDLARAIIEKDDIHGYAVELYVNGKSGIGIVPLGNPDGSGYGTLMPMTRKV